MCDCTVCRSSEPSVHICQSCHQKRMQTALDFIKRLQQELLTLKTKYSFLQLLVDHAKSKEEKG